jgi:polyvinyl alcohol dehydrogenase (cytochrome)
MSAGGLMAALALLAPVSAHAAEQQAYAAALNYATPAVVVFQGDTLKFTNLDTLAPHDLVSETPGLFKTKILSANQSEVVKGVEKLAPGTYNFHCSLHSWMTGSIQVVPGGGGGGGGTDVPNPFAVSSPDLGTTAPDPIDLSPQAAVTRLGPGAWPMYGHDLSNTRDGGKDGPAPADVPSLGPVWSYFSPKGDFTGTPVVSQNILVAVSSKGWVHALNATTGRVKWLADAGGPANGSAAIDGNRVFVPIATPGKPRLAAYDLHSGRRLWNRILDVQKDSDLYSSPVPYDGRVYIGVSGENGETSDPNVGVRGSVMALSQKTGDTIWKTYTVPEKHDGGAVWTTPAIDPASGQLYVGTGNAYHSDAAPTTDAVLQIDINDGKIVNWFQATAGDVWNGTSNRTAGPDYDFGASPQLFEAGGKKLVGDGEKNGTYWALDRDKMVPQWSATAGPPTPTVGGIVGSTAVDGQRIYGPNTTAGLEWAITTSGDMSWVSTDGGPLHFNPATVANGVVYSTDMSGFLSARDTSTGAIIARLPLGSPAWSGIAVAGGSVFTSTGTGGGSGYLVRYAPRNLEDTLTGPRPYANEGNEPTNDQKPDECASKGGKHCDIGNQPPTDPTPYAPPPKKDAASGHQGHNHSPGVGGGMVKGLSRRSDRYVPKPAGTVENLTFYYGPYLIGPGQDMNRPDIDLPLQNGFMLNVKPSLRRFQDLSTPTHMEAHIHHAHWFRVTPTGNKEDNYLGGEAEWVFGNGDEETRGDFTQRSAADPKGPIYGQYIPAGDPQAMIYMIHNKTAAPLLVYLVLDVKWLHGSAAEIKAARGWDVHDVAGMLMGRTYDVPRKPHGPGNQVGPSTTWTSTTDGTIIGMGGHLHPGGRKLIVENLGPANDPCPHTGNATAGTLLFNSEAIQRKTFPSEDFQMEVTHPGFRAPIHVGDRIRITGVYENKKHAWYRVMTHMGMYIDKAQPPQGRCDPYVVGPGGVHRTDIDPHLGVWNRHWTGHPDPYCGVRGAKPCNLPEKSQPVEKPTSTVTISQFTYSPGSRTAGSGDGGEIAVTTYGKPITFVDLDRSENIRHTITTCRWPCNGPYVGNYPTADGVWNSGTLGYDPIDGGDDVFTVTTPKDLPRGRYSYFCLIHPWMRGAFEIK